MGEEENMKSYIVRILSVTPLLMNRFGEDARYRVEKGTSNVARPKGDREKDAEERAYRMESGELYTPSTHIMGAIIAAAGHKKIGRRSAATFAAGGMYVQPDFIGHGTDEYVIDSRPVRIQKARIMRHRPKLESWKLEFTLDFDDDVFHPDLVKEILEIAGRRIGIGDFRPQRKGPFGRFMVTHFAEIKD